MIKVKVVEDPKVGGHSSSWEMGLAHARDVNEHPIQNKKMYRVGKLCGEVKRKLKSFNYVISFHYSLIRHTPYTFIFVTAHLGLSSCSDPLPNPNPRGSSPVSAKAYN